MIRMLVQPQRQDVCHYEEISFCQFLLVDSVSSRKPLGKETTSKCCHPLRVLYNEEALFVRTLVVFAIFCSLVSPRVLSGICCDFHACCQKCNSRAWGDSLSMAYEVMKRISTSNKISEGEKSIARSSL